MAVNYKVPVKDDYHLSTAKGDSYNVKDNFYITTRGMGKSTVAWNIVYNQWKKYGRVSLVVLPQICNITEAYVDDIANALNHFRKEEDHCRLKYSKSAIKDGIFDVYLQDNPNDEYKHFIRISAIKISVSKYKSLIIPNPGIMLIDEFIPNVRIGEKWIDRYTWRLDEMYTTFNRFADEQGRFIKRYFFGNPYSRFIPILLEKYNVDTLKLVPGNFIKGDNYIIDLQRPNDKLQEVLRRQNPDLLTSINEEWNRFMKGEFINDENYDITVNHPDNYKLRYVIRFLRHNLMIYRSDNPSPYYWMEDYNQDWWACINDDWKGNRQVLCLDFDNFQQGSILCLKEDKQKLQVIKEAIARRRISFKDVNTASLMENLFTSI